MPNLIEILIEARGNAKEALRGVAQESARLNDAMAPLAGAGGVVALVTSALVGVGTAAVAAARDFSRSIEQLENLSAITGVSPEKLDIAQQALSNLGLSSDLLRNALRFLNRNIGEGNELLTRLGVTTHDTWQAFVQVLSVLSRTADQTERTRIAFELFGRGGTDVLATIDRLGPEMERVAGIMAQMGGILDEKLIAKARDLDRQMDDLATSWHAAWNQMARVFVPAATTILDLIGAILAKGANLPEIIGAVVGASVGRRARRVRTRAELEETVVEAVGPVGFADMGPAIPRGMTFEQWMTMLGQIRMARLPVPAEEPARRGPIGVPDIQLLMRASEALKQVGEATEFISDGLRDAGELLRTVGASLEASFSQVFANLTNRFQTFRSAARAIVNSLVQDLLAAIGRMLARRFFHGLLQGIGSAIGGPIGAFIGAIGTIGTIGNAPAMAPVSPSTSVTINALDVRSFSDAFRSPGGSGRLMIRRMGEVR